MSGSAEYFSLIDTALLVFTVALLFGYNKVISAVFDNAGKFIKGAGWVNFSIKLIEAKVKLVFEKWPFSV